MILWSMKKKKKEPRGIARDIFWYIYDKHLHSNMIVAWILHEDEEANRGRGRT